MSDSQGNFCWYELATTDVDGAIRFYEDVVGWGTQVWEGEATYVRWTVDDAAVGGLTAMTDEVRKTGLPPHWFAYVTADDVDDLTKTAESLGGKVVIAPQDIPQVGRFSIVADPLGAALAVFKPLPVEAPHREQPTVGRFSWHELIAGDLDTEFRFYSRLFGWEKLEGIESPAGLYQIYGKNGQALGGMMAEPKALPAPPHWIYYITVDDIDAALKRVKRGGGQVLHEPMEVPGGSRVAKCMDPQGAAFALQG